MKERVCEGTREAKVKGGNSRFTFTILLQALHGSNTKFALQKQEKPPCGFFPRGFLAFSTCLSFLKCLKTAPFQKGTPAIPRKKRPTVMASQKIAGVSEKMGEGHFGRGTPIFSADRPRAFLRVP
jgi:hypothetical protein